MGRFCRTRLAALRARSLGAALLAVTFACGGPSRGAEETWEGPWLGGDLLDGRTPWVGNKLGLDHRVPVPWTAMAVADGAVSCWGRQTVFDGKALPQQVMTQGMPLLTRPITLSATGMGGGLEAADAGRGQVVEQHADRVVWHGRLEAGGVAVQTETEVEFDGFTWLTLTVGPAPQAKLKRLALDFPLQPYAAKYYVKSFEGYAPRLLKDTWGRVERSRRLKLQAFTLSNEERGISFSAEGALGWRLERRDRQVEWIKSEDEVLVRFNMIDLFIPRPVTEKRTISLGWNAMPVKPMPRDFRRYLITTIGGEPERYKDLFDTGMTVLGIRLTSFLPEDLRRKYAIERPDAFASYVPIDTPRPYEVNGFKRYMTAFRSLGKHGQGRITIYTVGNHHNILDPVFVRSWAEWSGAGGVLNDGVLEKVRGSKGQTPGSRRLCGWSRSFIDYKVWFMTHWLRELGLDGYYYDNQTFNVCQNPAHKHHQFTDERGRTLNVRPLLMYRQMAKRIYREIKRSNPQSIILGHGCSPMYPFVDVAIGVEFLHKLAGDKAYYTAFLTAEDCRGPFLNGHPLGIPFLWLPEHRGRYQYGPESAKSTRAMLSLLWLTDSSYWVAWSNFDVLRKDAAVRGQFRIWEADWIPFWRQELAQADKEGIHIPVYRKRDSALLVMSNPGKQSHERMTVSVNVTELFPRVPDFGNLRAKDAETGAELPMKRWLSMDQTVADITLSLPDQDYRLVTLSAGTEEE